MFLLTILNWLTRLVDIYTYVLIIYALLSWFPGGYQSKLGQIITKLAEPYLSLFRRLPLQFAGIDFTVLVAMLLLQFADRGLTILVMNLVY
jgi:YggT family protein